MALDLSQDHRIFLKRHDRKLWSFKDHRPNVVELAVLDYLRDNGFDGYFTERDYYLSLFMSLAGWPGEIGKRMPPAFVSPFFVYFHGTDGWLPLHKFSYAQAIAEVDAATIEIMTRKIFEFCAGKNSSSHYFSDLNSQPYHVLDFLSSFGIERVQHEIKEKFTQQELLDMRFLTEFDEKTRILYDKRAKVISTEGLARNLKRMPVFQRAFHRAGGFDTNIDQTEEFASHILEDALKHEVLDGCAYARMCRERTLEFYETTILDLQIWDALGTAIVEVKAPNDRLRREQKNTIERARQRGERACVIYVDEA